MDDTSEDAAPKPGGSCSIRERFPDLLREFKRIARQMLRKLPAPSVAADDLVSEAYLKLLHEEARRLQGNRSDLASKPDAVLKACFGMACRDVMSVRWHKRRRRREVGPMPEGAAMGLSQFDLADIDEMLSVLAASKPETARVVEVRVYGGLTVAECAEVFGMAPRTVDRHWALGKAWIRRQLLGRSQPDVGGG
ncbi:MAG: ECF-type sigma factor [Planctomycetes bacterium]|jgi:DNA-directed RNA polymerase specialized sigma24 family protein|nr:ECF-type sigma factor [Planctomycetota bacterium]